MSRQSLLLWAALSGAVFALPVLAQENVSKGNDKNPYQPPAWFARMARADDAVFGDPESFIVGQPPEPSTIMGRPHATRPKKACRIQTVEGEKWSFCEF